MRAFGVCRCNHQARWILDTEFSGIAISVFRLCNSDQLQRRRSCWSQIRARVDITPDHRGAVILGVAYKKNVDDARESPAFALWEELWRRGAEVCYHDPHVAALPHMRAHADLAGRESRPLTAELLATQDAVLIATDHDAVDYAAVVRHARLVVDTRNATKEIAGRDKTVVLA